MAHRLLTATLLTGLALLVPTFSGELSASDPVSPASGPTIATSVDDEDRTRPTINEFFPEERPLSDCLSSLPKPDCGSRSRGGWALGAVFLSMVAGLSFIAWRIVRASRSARRTATGQAAP